MPALGDQAEIVLLNTGRGLLASLLVVLVVLIALRVWNTAVSKISGEMLERAEVEPREKQLKIQTLTAVVRNTGSVVLMALGVLMVLGQFMDIAPLLAGAGVIGIAIGLGAQGLIRDLISGFFILFEDHFAVGDVVKVNDQYAGFVEHLDLRKTNLRGLDGVLFTVPNGEIRVVANMTRGWSRMIVDVVVTYREDTDRVIGILEKVNQALMEHPTVGVLMLEPPEIQGVEALTDTGVTIRVLLKTQPIKQWDVGRVYRAMVKKALDQNGVEMAFSHRTVYLRSESGLSDGEIGSKSEAVSV